MKRLHNMTLEEMLILKSENLRFLLNDTAHKTGKDCWLYAPKNTESKVCIVAHIDTVFDDGFSKWGNRTWNTTTKKWDTITAINPPKRVFHDRQKGVYWSPDGLGADDRAGVFAGFHLFKHIPEKHRPFLLLTDYEEVGGKGAKEVFKAFPELQDVTMFIELDRQGADDIVTYQDEGQDFIEYLEGFGFTESSGSYSDVSTFCPEFMICGANLSIGYYRQHSEEEYLIESELWATVEKVKKICADNSQVWVMPEKKPFTSAHGYGNYSGYAGYSSNLLGTASNDLPYVCPECHINLTIREVEEDEMCPYCYTEVTNKNNDAVTAELDNTEDCLYCGKTLWPEEIKKDKDGDVCCEACLNFYSVGNRGDTVKTALRGI